MIDCSGKKWLRFVQKLKVKCHRQGFWCLLHWFSWTHDEFPRRNKNLNLIENNQTFGPHIDASEWCNYSPPISSPSYKYRGPRESWVLNNVFKSSRKNSLSMYTDVLTVSESRYEPVHNDFFFHYVRFVLFFWKEQQRREVPFWLINYS